VKRRLRLGFGIFPASEGRMLYKFLVVREVSVMKKSLAKKITLSILAGAVLMSSSVVWAEENPVLEGWTVLSNKYIWDGTSSSAPNGEVNGIGHNFTRYFYGKYYGDDSNTVATNGKVTITGGSFGASGSNIIVCGGYSSNSAATSNKVDISGEDTNVYAVVYGGMSNGTNATEDNTVTIKGGTFGGNVYGGYSLNKDASTMKNTVTIEAGTFGDASNKVFIYGGYSASGNVNENKVVISGGTFAGGSIYGGYTSATVDVGDAGGNASKNTVTISDGMFGDENNEVFIYGGCTKAGAGDGDASDNIVTISGGSFEGNIEGGSADGGGNATGNTVTISGGSFTGEIYGGKTLNSPSNYNATKNTVNISGNAVLENAKLYGGYVIDKPYYGGADTPNTLNIGWDGEKAAAWTGANAGKVKSIAGFDVINFNYINWSHEGNVVETDTLELNNTKVGKVVIGSGTVENGEWMNLISAGSVNGTFATQEDIIIRTGLTTSETVKGDIELIDNNLKLTITTDTSDGVSGGTGSGDGGSGTSSSTNVPTGATSFVDAIDKVGEETVAYKVLDAVYTNYTTDEEQKKAATNMLQLGEAGGQSATAANISRNVSGATVNRMSFGGRGGVRHRGGHGPADFNEKDGSAVWAQYVHGKDKVDGMALADGVTTSYESQFNGVVLGVDFKEVGKYQSGIAFNYGEGDSHTKNIAFSRSDYDFWGIGYYGAVKNADSNVIFDINYAKTDSEVKQQFRGGVELEAEPETTTISAGVKIEKLIDRGAMQFVPYAGLRFMSVDTDEYSANYLGKEAFNYSADRQNIWLLPVGVSFRQENVYDSGWVVTPKVDLSYIWAFGDTENEMTVRTPDVAEAARLGYTVMNDGSFLGSIGLEAEKGDWTFGVAYSYQKSSDSRSDRWYVDAKYSF